MLAVRPCTIAEVWAVPHFNEMLDAYEAECAVAGLPPTKAKFENYVALESAGALHPFGAWLDDYFIGFVGVLAPVLPHYSRVVAVTESLFVMKEYRSSGAGLRLLRLAEKKAVELGSPGFLISAPLFGDLCELLPRVGYVPTGCTFFKNFAAPAPRIRAMGADAIAKVGTAEKILLQYPQVECETRQILFAGLYTRTVKIPAGVMITGALIKIPTMLIVDGDVTVYVGDEPIRLNGHNVLSAEAGRKQAFYAHSDVHLTMAFATEAVTVEQAEEEFTDEVDLLQTRQLALNFSSGERKCLV